MSVFDASSELPTILPVAFWSGGPESAGLP